MKQRRTFALLLAAVLLLSACGAERSAAEPESSPTAVPTSTPAPKTANDNSGVKLVGTPVGTLDCRAEFGTVFSEIWEVPEGESVTRRFYNYTDGLGLWDNFLVILQNTDEGHSAEEAEDYAEYAVLRADHYGWGEGFSDAKKESDWNWESFTEDMNGALIELTVSLKKGLVDVRFTATVDEETVYHQSYTGIKAEGPVYFCLSVENACLDLLPEETESE